MSRDSRRLPWTLLVLLLAAGAVVAAATLTEITGAGSTFVEPVLAQWGQVYQAQGGSTRLAYQSIGSGGGIQHIEAASVDFGASDMPVKPEELKAFGLGQFPVVIGGVVPVVNLAGVAPGTLRFTGPLLADIFLGRVTQWNDPALRALNPGVQLPDARIVVVHRTDGSGTTFIWADYLSKVSAAWRGKVGEGALLLWPTGIGARGNEGVAGLVGRIKNSIGYVEYAYIKGSGLGYGTVQNRAGKFIAPGPATFAAAAAGADWPHATDFYLLLTDSTGAGAYPVTGSTFVIMHKHAKDPLRSQRCLDFFRWALASGQQEAAGLGYVPLPPALVAQIERYWQAELRYQQPRP